MKQRREWKLEARSTSTSHRRDDMSNFGLLVSRQVVDRRFRGLGVGPLETSIPSLHGLSQKWPSQMSLTGQ
jgi:hypothetical protein